MSLRIAFDCDGVLADMESALEELTVRLFGPIPPPAAPEAERGEGVGVGGSSGEAAEAPRADRAGGVSAAGRGEAVEAGPGAPGAPPEVAAEEEQLEPAGIRRLTRRQQHELWEAVRQTENFWETLHETEPGIIARLAALARERRWEVIFITQRPSSAGDTTQLQTQRWLTAHGFELPSVYVITGTRGKVAAALSLDVVVDDRPENCLDVKVESRARAILVWNGDPASLPPNARNLGIEPVAGIGACLDLLCAIPAEKQGLLSKLKKLVGA